MAEQLDVVNFCSSTSRDLLCGPFKNRKYKTWFPSSRNSQPKLRYELAYLKIYIIPQSPYKQLSWHGCVYLGRGISCHLKLEMEIFSPEEADFSAGSSSYFVNRLVFLI